MWLLLFLSVYSGLTAANSIGCREAGQIVSTDELLLPAQNIEASSELLIVDPDSTPSQFIFEGHFFVNFGVSESTTVWCTAPNDLSSNVILTFTEPVVITSFVSGGYSLPMTYNYVDQFTVEFAASLDDDFMPYTEQNLFTASAINTLFLLEEPFEAQKVKLSIVHHTDNFDANIGCWTMAIFGCNATEAIRPPPVTTVAIPTGSSSLDPPLTTTITVTQSACPSQSEDLEPSPTVASGETEPSLSQMAVVEKDFMALAIVLPIALLTIIAVFVIVAVGVYVCVRHRRNASPPVGVQYSIQSEGGSMKVLDNSGLYMSASPGGGDEQLMPDTVGNVPNLLYQEMHSRPGEAVDQIYETIGSGMEDQPNHNYDMLMKHHPNDGVQMSMNESYHVTKAGGEDGEYYYPSVVVPGTDGARGSSSTNGMFS